MIRWDETSISQATDILNKYTPELEKKALAEIARKLGFPVTRHSIRHGFQRAGHGNYRDNYQGVPQMKTPAKFDDLISLTRKNPISFPDLCNKLDLSPQKAEKLIKDAKAAGLRIKVGQGHVGLDLDEKSVAPLAKVGISPVVGKRQKVAVISDTHLGSKYCLREQLIDFIKYAYEQGVREILHPGDVLDGCYRHGMFEVSHVSLDDQAQDLFETLPQLPGLTYHCITGNHDFTFTEKVGIDVGSYLMNYFQERGRSDLKFYGDRSAFLELRGAVIHLWHPKKGVGFAKSYALQRQIENYSSIKPQILLVGHWHIHATVYERSVHGIACPTFQGGGSAFSKSLGGAPAIGGLILSWLMTENGSMRSFSIEKRSYWEVEKPYAVFNETDAIQVGKKGKP